MRGLWTLPSTEAVGAQAACQLDLVLDAAILQGTWLVRELQPADVLLRLAMESSDSSAGHSQVWMHAGSRLDGLQRRPRACKWHKRTVIATRAEQSTWGTW